MENRMFTKPPEMTDYQWNYKKMELEEGKVRAKEYVANRLRRLADMVQSEDYPDVFGFSESKGDALPLIKFSITLSYPWPG